MRALQTFPALRWFGRGGETNNKKTWRGLLILSVGVGVMLSVVPLFFLKLSRASDLGSESLRGLSPPIWYSPGGASHFHAPSALSPSLSPVSTPVPSNRAKWPVTVSPPCLAWAPRCQLQGRETFTARLVRDWEAFPLLWGHTTRGRAKDHRGNLVFFPAWYHFSADRWEGAPPRAARRANQEHPVD